MTISCSLYTITRYLTPIHIKKTKNLIRIIKATLPKIFNWSYIFSVIFSLDVPLPARQVVAQFLLMVFFFFMFLPVLTEENKRVHKKELTDTDQSTHNLMIPGLTLNSNLCAHCKNYYLRVYILLTCTNFLYYPFSQCSSVEWALHRWVRGPTGVVGPRFDPRGPKTLGSWGRTPGYGQRLTSEELQSGEPRGDALLAWNGPTDLGDIMEKFNGGRGVHRSGWDAACLPADAGPTLPSHPPVSPWIAIVQPLWNRVSRDGRRGSWETPCEGGPFNSPHPEPAARQLSTWPRPAK